MNSVVDICENAMCTGCGACAGICLSEAIEIKENPAGFLRAYVDFKKCVQCGKCLAVCPSNNNNILPRVMETGNIFYGTCIAGYAGYASDPEIRQNSQSGGIVTALLCYLLERGEIDGAVVNNFSPSNHRPYAFVAKTKEELISSSGSYYTQTSVVKTILENQDKNLAAVLLGCQAESLELIGLSSPEVTLPLYKIGLVCAGQNSGFMIDDLIQQSRCSDNVIRFRFKDKEYGGWPGNVHIETQNKHYSLHQSKRHEIKPIYELNRCLTCFDQMNILCDIVCGDPWGIKDKQHPDGYTVVIARTEKGQELLQNALRDGVVVLSKLEINDILEGQTVNSRLIPQFYSSYEIFKKKEWLYPYNAKITENYIFKNKNISELEQRLIYTRKFYCSTSIDMVQKMIKSNKRKIFIQRYIKLPYIALKKVIKKIKCCLNW